MESIPLARLLSASLRLVVDDMHERLADAGFDDLRPLHGYVLNAADGDGATASSLVSVLGITKQAVAKVVDELTELGYVRRGVAASDARRRPVMLTDRGRAALAASVRIQRRIERDLAELVGAEQLATTREVLGAVVDAAVDAGRPVHLRPTW